MNRKLLVAALAFVALGMPRSSIGVAWPSAADELGRPVAELGYALATFVICYAAATALSARLVRRWGSGRVLVGSATVATVGLGGVLGAPAWPVGLAALGLVGFGGGFVDATVNTETALRHGARAMGLLHASFGIGATLGPLAVTVGLARIGSWRPAFLLFALVQVVVLAGFVGSRRRWVAAPSEPEAEPVETATVVRTRARNLAIAMFALLAAAETAGAQWGFSLLNVGRGLSETAAGLAVTGYYTALTGARLLLGVAGHRMDPVRVVGVGAVTATVGAVLLWWAPVPAVGATGLVALGAGIGPLFPLGMLLTPARVGEEATPAVVGYQLVGANVGSAIYPAAIGLAVDRWGLVAVGPAVALAAVALLAVVEGLRRLPTGSTTGSSTGASSSP